VPWAKPNQYGTWMPPSYDPEQNLEYFSTTENSPTQKYQKAANHKTNLYHTTTQAHYDETRKI
jgi:hypothetical protein